MRIRPPSKESHSPAGTYVDTTWVAPLRAAAAVARRAASSEADVLRAVAEELRRLHLVGGVALLQEDGNLVIRSRILSPTVEGTLKRLTGLSVIGFQFAADQVEAYHRALQTGEAQYYPEREPIIRGLVPQRFHPLVPVILRLVGGNHPTIVAPLISADKPFGTINVTANWLSQEHVPSLAALADNIAVSLAQVRSRQEMEDALERERLRNQVAQTLTSALELPVVLERMIELAVEISNADVGAFALVEEDGETLVYPYSFGLPEGIEFRPTRRGHGLAWEMLEERRPIMLEDYSAHEKSLSEWAKIGLRAFLGTPLYAGDQPVGAMGLFKTQRGDTFRPEQLEMVKSIASMAAIAIQNAQLYRQMKRRAEESHALIETSSSVSATLDLQTVLQLIVEQAKGLLEADGSRIHMLDLTGERLRTIIALDPHADAMQTMELAPSEGLAGHVLQTGQPMIINDPVADDMGAQVPGTPDDEPECLALAPLTIRQRTMGVMVVRRMGVTRPFKTSELNLLAAFAAQAAIAIENADLYGQIEKQAQRLEQQVIERTRELAISEARYRGLVETSLTGILHISPEGTIKYANRFFTDLIQYPLEELSGLPLEEFSDRFLPETGANIVLKQIRDRIASTRPVTEMFEVEFLRRDGERIPTVFSVSRISDDEGTDQGVTCLVLDISARKSLETALRSERDRLEAILASIGDAVIVTDREGVIKYVNPAWERLNGYPQEKILGQNASLLRGDETPTEARKKINDALKEGRSWHGELVNVRQDGSTYDASVTLTPIRNPSGKVVNFVAVLHDISSLKEVDRLKSRFVSDVSHELRTPLTNIRLYVDLLKESAENSRTSEYLDTLFRESERLSHLIDDLLSLSRLESRATPFDPRPIDLNELLLDLAADRRVMAAGQEIELEVRTGAGLPPAMGDRRLLGQVFTNLLTNAMNYTPKGGQILLKTTKLASGEKDWIVAQVEDSGLGILPEERPMIFKRFFRGRASQATGAPGTGLGLAICKEIAELHGGRIEVESKPGNGTRVSVWLPVNGVSSRSISALH
jgi:PAS domain S-box-containing protein